MGTDPRRLLHTIVRKLSANRKHEQDEHGEAKQKGFKNRLRYKPARRKTVQNALAVVKCDPCFFFFVFHYRYVYNRYSPFEFVYHE